MDFTKLCDNSAAKITSAGTLCHEKKGSFREIYATYNHLVGPEHCKDDSTLLEAVLDLLSGVEFTVPGACLKSAEKAEGFRVEGNKNYKEKKLQDAIVCYNRSILFAPPAEKVHTQDHSSYAELSLPNDRQLFLSLFRAYHWPWPTVRLPFTASISLQKHCPTPRLPWTWVIPKKIMSRYIFFYD